MLQCQSISSHTLVLDYILLLISIKVSLQHNNKDDQEITYFSVVKKSRVISIFLQKVLIFHCHIVPQRGLWPLKVQVDSLTWRETLTFIMRQIYIINTLPVFFCAANSCLKKILHFALSLSHKSVHYKIIRYLVNIICISKVLQNLKLFLGVGQPLPNQKWM